MTVFYISTFEVYQPPHYHYAQVFHCIDPWARVLFTLWHTNVKNAKSAFLYLLAIFRHFFQFTSCKKHFKDEDLALLVIYNTCTHDWTLLAGELYSFTNFSRFFIADANISSENGSFEIIFSLCISEKTVLMNPFTANLNRGQEK